VLFFIIITVLIFIILILQKKLYLKLFDKINEGSRGIIHSRWTKTIIGRELGLLWKKEIKTFIRSPSQWSQLLIIGAMVIVFIINMRSIPIPHPSIKNIIAYINLGMVAFIIIGLNSRFTFTAIPMEGSGIVHILASPLKRKKYFHFKLLFFTIPQIIIGIILHLTADITLQLDPFFRLTGIVFLLPVIFFLSILAFFFGLQVNESIPLSPQHLIVSKAGFSYMLWGLAFVVFSMIYFIRPLFIYFFSLLKKEPVPVLEIVLWFVGFLVINFLLTGIIYKKCQKLWNKREFIY
jgi:ABC-2 type transport system permease protein